MSSSEEDEAPSQQPANQHQPLPPFLNNMQPSQMPPGGFYYPPMMPPPQTQDSQQSQYPVPFMLFPGPNGALYPYPVHPSMFMMQPPPPQTQKPSIEEVGIFGQEEEEEDEVDELEGTSKGFTVDGLNFYQQQTTDKVEWPNSNDQEPSQPSGIGQQFGRFNNNGPLNYDTQTQDVQPLETIFEDNQEYQENQTSGNLKQGGRPKSQYGRGGHQQQQYPKFNNQQQADQMSKGQNADAYLNNLNRKQQDSHIQAQVKARLQDDLHKVFDISQMSQWTGWTQESQFMPYLVQNQRKVSQLNERLRVKDKEELSQEILDLRSANNIQSEEIKLLKIEINKLKKKQISKNGIQSQAVIQGNQQLAQLMIDPFDHEKLKAEINTCKKEINSVKEENRVLVGSIEKYKKRANYAKAKYYEIKSQSSANQNQQQTDSKYRLQNSELKLEIKRLQQDKISQANEITSLKVKLIQSLQLNKVSREESERAVKQVQKLFARLETLEKKEGERREYEEIKNEIEEAMRKEQLEKEQEESKKVAQEIMMASVEPDGNTTREVHFKLDTDSESDKLSESSSSSSSSSGKSKDHSKSKPKKDKSILNTQSAVTSAALPILIKKQLDAQATEIKDLRNLLKEQEMKLRLRKNDFDRVHGIEQKKEIMTHKERIETLYRQKFEDEKRKLMKNKMEEFDSMIKDNKALKEEISRMQLSMRKLQPQQ